VVALVGYTNSGKSTLLNLLTEAGVLAEDKLFATLDPVSRRINLPDGTEIMLVDTVGFIDKLPHEFIDAFRSTLEEAAYASVLLHVVDVSDPNRDRQMRVVDEVLTSLDADDKPRITVYNKADMINEAVDGGVNISAKQRTGIEELMQTIQEKVHALKTDYCLLVPYTAGKALDFLHRNGSVLSEEYTEEGTLVRIRLSEAELGTALSMGAQTVGDK
jgi:GTP-binding protein HflX